MFDDFDFITLCEEHEEKYLNWCEFMNSLFEEEDHE